MSNMSRLSGMTPSNEEKYIIRKHFLRLIRSNYWKQMDHGYLSKRSLLLLLEANSCSNDHLEDRIHQWKYIDQTTYLLKHLNSMARIPIIKYPIRRIIISYIKSIWEVTSSFLIAHNQVYNEFVGELNEENILRKEVYDETNEDRNKATELLSDIYLKYPEYLSEVEVYILYLLYYIEY